MRPRSGGSTSADRLSPMSRNDVGIGVDVGGTNTKGAIVTASGEILADARRPTDAQAGTKGILGLVEELLERAAADGVTVTSVGIGAAGFIDATAGAVTFSPNLVYDDPELATAVAARTGLPTFVDNDANAAAWGEYRLGSARGITDLAFVTLGTGVGSGFIVDGRLVRGARGSGAELGHIVIDPDGPVCPCGLRGCLEQFASGTAIARMAAQAIEGKADTAMSRLIPSGNAPRAEDVTRAAEEYDETARSILRRAGVALGTGLSNVVNLFDPQVIVLGGGLVAAGEPYLGPARDRLAAMLNAQRRRPVRLDVSRLGNSAGLLGAALLGIEARDT